MVKRQVVVVVMEVVQPDLVDMVVVQLGVVGQPLVRRSAVVAVGTRLVAAATSLVGSV